VYPPLFPLKPRKLNRHSAFTVFACSRPFCSESPGPRQVRKTHSRNTASPVFRRDGSPKSLLPYGPLLLFSFSRHRSNSLFVCGSLPSHGVYSRPLRGAFFSPWIPAPLTPPRQCSFFSSFFYFLERASRFVVSGCIKFSGLPPLFTRYISF